MAISKRDILEISCKVLGLICLIRGIVYLSSAPFIVNRTVFAYLLVPSLFYFVSALILLKWSSSIAHLLMREDEPVELKEGKNWVKSLYTLSLRVVGAVVFIKAVPMIIGAILEIIFRSRVPSITTISAWIKLVLATVHLILGIYFVGGAKEIVRIAVRGSLREQDSSDA